MLRIFVSVDAKQVVEGFSADFDMKEQGVASRVYEWFGRQPVPVQKWILGLTDGQEGDAIQKFATGLLKGGPHRDISSEVGGAGRGKKHGDETKK